MLGIDHARTAISECAIHARPTTARYLFSAALMQLLRCPHRQRFAADLGVMADIHREARMAQEIGDAGGERMRCSGAAQLLPDVLLLHRAGHPGIGVRFIAKHRTLPAHLAHAH